MDTELNSHVRAGYRSAFLNYPLGTLLITFSSAQQEWINGSFSKEADKIGVDSLGGFEYSCGMSENTHGDQQTWLTASEKGHNIAEKIVSEVSAQNSKWLRSKLPFMSVK